MTGGSSNSNKPAVFKESFKYQKACPEKEHAQKKKRTQQNHQATPQSNLFNLFHNTKLFFEKWS